MNFSDNIKVHIPVNIFSYTLLLLPWHFLSLPGLFQESWLQGLLNKLITHAKESWIALCTLVLSSHWSSRCLEGSQYCSLEWLKIVPKLNGSLYRGIFPFMKSALYCLSSYLSVESTEDWRWRAHHYWKWRNPPVRNAAEDLGKGIPSKDDAHRLCLLFTYTPWCPFIQQAGKQTSGMHLQQIASCFCLPLPSLGNGTS